MCYSFNLDVRLILCNLSIFSLIKLLFNDSNSITDRAMKCRKINKLAEVSKEAVLPRYLHGQTKGGYTLVTLPRIVTPYCDSVDGTRDRVTNQKLVTR